ncbi:MAG: hypothetical protein AAGD13_05480 [Pseudomonadota bacterium]
MLRRAWSAETPRSLAWSFPLALNGIGLLHGDIFVFLFGWMAALPAALLARSVISRRLFAIIAAAVLFVVFWCLLLDVLLTPQSTKQMISGGVTIVLDGALTHDGYIHAAKLAGYYAVLVGVLLALSPILDRDSE